MGSMSTAPLAIDNLKILGKHSRNWDTAADFPETKLDSPSADESRKPKAQRGPLATSPRVSMRPRRRPRKSSPDPSTNFGLPWRRWVDIGWKSIVGSNFATHDQAFNDQNTEVTDALPEQNEDPHEVEMLDANYDIDLPTVLPQNPENFLCAEGNSTGASDDREIIHSDNCNNREMSRLLSGESDDIVRQSVEGSAVDNYTISATEEVRDPERDSSSRTMQAVIEARPQSAGIGHGSTSREPPPLDDTPPSEQLDPNLDPPTSRNTSRKKSKGRQSSTSQTTSDQRLVTRALSHGLQSIPEEIVEEPQGFKRVTLLLPPPSEGDLPSDDTSSQALSRSLQSIPKRPRGPKRVTLLLSPPSEGVSADPSSHAIQQLPISEKARGKLRAAEPGLLNARSRENEVSTVNISVIGRAPIAETPTGVSSVLSGEDANLQSQASTAPLSGPLCAGTDANSPNAMLVDLHNCDHPILTVKNDARNTCSSGSVPTDPPPQVTIMPSSIDYSPIVSLMSSGFAQLNNTVQQSLENTDKVLKAVRCAQHEIQQQLQNPPQIAGPSGQQASLQFGASDASRQRQPTTSASRRVPRPARNHPNWTKFLNATRDYLKRLLKIRTLDESLLRVIPLTDQELLDYSTRTLNCIQITPEKFRLDMLRPLGCPFNAEAIEVFTMDFLEKVQKDGWYQSYSIPVECLTVKEVSETIHQHLKHVFKTYKQLNTELKTEAHKIRLAKASRSTRKGLLFKKRLDTAREEDALNTHLDLIEQIGTKGISSDESDFSRDPEVFWRVSPRWRSSELEMFMYRLDEIYYAKKTTNVGRCRRPGGRPQRQRLHSDKVNDDASVPKGLPRNCYNETWVNSLSRFIAGKLEMKDEQYDFSIDDIGLGDSSDNVQETEGENN